MSDSPTQYLLGFGSAHKALKAESILKEAGISFRLLPAPGNLASHCELVIRVDAEGLGQAFDILESTEAKPLNIYIKEDGEYVKM